MIKLNDIYDKTNGGLDIFLRLRPDLAPFAGTKKKFRLREGERTPSAVFQKGRDGVWRIVDYGDDTVTPIDLFMQQEGMAPNQFYEAVKRLAMTFGVSDAIDPAVHRPRIEYRQPDATQREGDTFWEFADSIPTEHLSILGPQVTAEVADSLHWHEARFFGRVGRFQGRVEAQVKYSTAAYPIFMRECQTTDGKVFYKVYEPLNPDKAWRFHYAPAGVKPATYVNGLAELQAQFSADDKAPAAVICSGERDALCCRAMGHHPIWFNSETHQVTAAEMHSIAALAKVVYNIPDLDDTGVRKGKQLALRFPEVHTVWLPGWLNDFTDQRGRRSKDLRDWAELRRNKNDFRQLLDKALPAKFWETVATSSGRREARILGTRLYHFLWLNGFATLHDDRRHTARLIHIDGNVVTEVKGKDVRRFIRDWAEEHSLPECVRNSLAATYRLRDTALENLREVKLDFTDYTPTSQTYHFPGKVVQVSADGISETSPSASPSDRFVWQQSVIPHPFHQLPPMFHISETTADGQRQWDIQLAEDIPSNMLKFLVNTSRLYWREEMEQRFTTTADDGITDYDWQQAEAYARANPFRIDGDGLTPQQIAKQKQNLVSKIQAIGYMFHKYKSPSHAWAPLCMDNKIGENGQCNGRSGKSFLFSAIGNILNMVNLSGRDTELMKNRHVFDRVSEDTDFVMVDDCSAQFSVDTFYDLITGKMVVNPKCHQSMELDFEESPKFVFTTNYVPRDFSASSEARMFYMVFSDYYHESALDNDYLETRSIRDDFQMDLFTRQYPEEMWNADINFFLQCLQFYLQHAHETLKILPPMDNILLRKSRQDMGTNFEQWADDFFSEEGGNLDRELPKALVIEQYMRYAPTLRVTPSSFGKQLKAYCAFAPHIEALNPLDLGNKGRIQRRVDGKLQDYYYVRSHKGHTPHPRLGVQR